VRIEFKSGRFNNNRVQLVLILDPCRSDFDLFAFLLGKLSLKSLDITIWNELEQSGWLKLAH